jgi:hypothetical protein
MSLAALRIRHRRITALPRFGPLVKIS